ncbi:MAG: hypothetical protein HC803_05680 [Saprospiraceae bacterium]|nr:hypothetical protein [Saprospiraceae bacterium]
MEIIIRNAEASDLEAIWQMWKVIMEQKIYFAYDENFPREEIEKSWINLKNHVFVATQNEEIVGAYIFKANQPGYGGHIANAAYMVKLINVDCELDIICANILSKWRKKLVFERCNLIWW